MDMLGFTTGNNEQSFNKDFEERVVRVCGWTKEVLEHSPRPATDKPTKKGKEASLQKAFRSRRSIFASPSSSEIIRLNVQGDQAACSDTKTNIVFYYVGLTLQRNFCFDVNGRFGTSCLVTLYKQK